MLWTLSSSLLLAHCCCKPFIWRGAGGRRGVNDCTHVQHWCLVFEFDCIILFTFLGGVSSVSSVSLRFWHGILLNQAWREIDWKENTIMRKQFIPFSLTEGRVLSILWNKYYLPVCFKKWKLLISLWWLWSLFGMGFFFYSVQSFDLKST